MTELCFAETPLTGRHENRKYMKKASGNQEQDVKFLSRFRPCLHFFLSKMMISQSKAEKFDMINKIYRIRESGITQKV